MHVMRSIVSINDIAMTSMMMKNMNAIIYGETFDITIPYDTRMTILTSVGRNLNLCTAGMNLMMRIYASVTMT